MMVHLTRDLVEILLHNIIVPPASGLGDVDGITQSLKHGIVSYVLDCGDDARKDALAKIFDKSDRWIYRQLEEMDGRKEKRHLGEDHAGYELMVRVVEFFTQLYPKETTAQACVQALRRAKVNVTLSTIEPVLNLCVDQGYLSRITVEVGGIKETVYRSASNGTYVGSDADAIDRKARVSRRVRSLVPMLRSFIQGHPLARCSMISMGLPEDKIKIFVEKTLAFMTDLLKELQAEVDKEAVDKKVEISEFRALFIAGPGPFNDLFRDKG